LGGSFACLASVRLTLYSYACFSETLAQAGSLRKQKKESAENLKKKTLWSCACFSEPLAQAGSLQAVSIRQHTLYSNACFFEPLSPRKLLRSLSHSRSACVSIRQHTSASRASAARASASPARRSFLIDQILFFPRSFNF
jgi:hypothetical protein